MGLKSLSILKPTNHGKVPLPHCRLAVSKAHLLSTQSLPLQHQPQLPAQHRPQGAGGTESSVNKLSLTLTLVITRYDSKSRAWPHANGLSYKKHVKYARMHGNSVSPICVIAMKKRAAVSPCLSCPVQPSKSTFPSQAAAYKTNYFFDLLSATTNQ